MDWVLEYWSMRMRMFSTVIKLGTSMYIMTKSGIFLIRWYCCAKLYCSIFGISCTTVVYGTVEWRLGGAIGPLDDGFTSV